MRVELELRRPDWWRAGAELTRASSTRPRGWAGPARSVDTRPAAVPPALLSGGSAVADAELVVLWVGHDHPVRSVLASNAGFEPPCAERLEAGRFAVDVGRLDIEVHPVLDDLGFGH